MIVRRPFSLAGSEAERATSSFVSMGDLPMEHNVRSFDRAAIIVRRRGWGYKTVAYPGGVLKYYEAVGGKIPLQHRVHPEGLEAYYQPELTAPPDFSEPWVLSNVFNVPAATPNFPTIDFTVPVGREVAMQTAFFDVSDTDIATIRFTIVFSNMKTRYANQMIVSSFQHWKTPKRLEEQERVQVFVDNTAAGIREVSVGLDGWIYLIRKRTR